MLKPRLIGLVLVRDGWAVQSIGFATYLPIGRPHIAVRYLNRWGVDEVVVLHIDRHMAEAAQVQAYAREGQVPLSVGGGITSVAHVSMLIASGADKVVLNTALADNAGLARDVADLYGVQSIVGSVDARRGTDDAHVVYVDSGQRPTGVPAAVAAAAAVSAGCGEVLVTSVDNDGCQRGLDLKLIAGVRAAVSVPVIAAGGAGHASHVQAAIDAGATAVAVGNLLHFTEHSVIVMKRQLRDRGLDLRLDSHVTYGGHRFDSDGRLQKLQGAALEDLRFRCVAEERI